MLNPRIIPCLLVHNKGLVKTVGFSNAKYVGDPVNAVRIFNEKEVDELTVLDIDATVQGREPDYKLIGQLAAECRMPLCYGGGVKTVEQAKTIVGLGVEKVALSSAAIHDPGLVAAIATEIGSQSVVVVLDAKHRTFRGGYELFVHNGKTATGKTPAEVAAEMERQGAGEIVINSIDRDGAMKGYDLTLARAVRSATSLPMSVLGGAGSLQDIGTLISELGLVGAAAGSLFVFKGVYRAVLINYPAAADKDRLVRESWRHA
jgi:cyclase